MNISEFRETTIGKFLVSEGAFDGFVKNTERTLLLKDFSFEAYLDMRIEARECFDGNDLLLSSFRWSEAKEGAQFWVDVYDKFCENVGNPKAIKPEPANGTITDFDDDLPL